VSFVRDSLGLMGTSAIALPAALATQVALARWLSVEERGHYSLALAFALLAAFSVQLGWPSAVIARLRSARSAPETIATLSLLAIVVLSGLGVGAAMLLEPILRPRFLSDAPRTIYGLAVLLIPLTLAATVLRGLARGIGRFDLQNTHDRVLAVGMLVVVVALLGWRDGSAQDVLIAVIVVQNCAASWLGLRVLALTGLSTRLQLRELSACLRFGSKTYFVVLLARLHESADLFMLAALLSGSASVAIYAIAVAVVNLLSVLPEALCVAAYPRLAEMEDGPAAHFAAALCRRVLAASAFVALGLALVLPLAIPLFFGSDYAASVAPALWLLPGSAAFVVYRVLSRFFTAQDRQGVTMGVQAAAVAMNVALNLVLIPRYGVAGAAMASSASYTLQAALLLVAFSRRTGVAVGETLRVRSGDIREILDGARASLRSEGASA
jgi:O-antigen/teichoic acid export membrane protein